MSNRYRPEESLLRWSPLGVMVFLALMGAVRFVQFAAPYGRGVIVADAAVLGSAVAGLDMSRALEAAEAGLDRVPQAITVKALDQTARLEFGAAYSPPDPEPAVLKAAGIGRGDDWLDNFLIYLRGTGRLEFNPAPDYDVAALGPELVELAERVYREPVNARLDVQNREVVPHRVGYRLDPAEALSFLHELAPGYSGGTVTLPVRELKPPVTDDEYLRIDFAAPLVSFSTRYNKWSRERSGNLALAAAALDGTALEPGEAFSFNEKVGPRTAAAGFRHAPVIINNRLEPGIGGGVCQVSSTLYNAALLADLEIIERHNHSLATSYVSLGRDAAVLYPALDLKFRNTLPAPIYIYGQAEDGLLTFSIYGSAGRDYEVEIWHAVNRVFPFDEEVVEDPALAPGVRVVDEKGIRGFDANIHMNRVYPDGGKETVRLYRDLYKSSPAQVRVGPGG